MDDSTARTAAQGETLLFLRLAVDPVMIPAQGGGTTGPHVA
jgi:hypothetical protein